VEKQHFLCFSGIKPEYFNLKLAFSGLIQTYIERELPLLGMNINRSIIRKLWTMNKLSRSLEVCATWCWQEGESFYWLLKLNTHRPRKFHYYPRNEGLPDKRGYQGLQSDYLFTKIPAVIL
jgi:hypothetical protein